VNFEKQEDKEDMFFKTALSLYRDTSQLKNGESFFIRYQHQNDYQEVVAVCIKIE
jgi:hypothetical protein